MLQFVRLRRVLLVSGLEPLPVLGEKGESAPVGMCQLLVSIRPAQERCE